ncbi:retrovirus-related pol polyprotein from transposon TNT 1-94 [Tanacetum coccineum]|uniref:Retrovirus-related pol polyprotein from transposon TNT 1-94 n=1 Tax=Tanacetum coccineum TaxID=301880 RepID=A0ABQ4WLY3_9ASTR
MLPSSPRPSLNQPRLPLPTTFRSGWVYKLKRDKNGAITRYKASSVAKGFRQQPGIDFHETFSPVVKSTTIRAVLSLAVTNNWPLRQLDVHNAFLNGNLKEQVYMKQPLGFIDPQRPNHVCLLHKSLYGLKQALHAWFERLSKALFDLGFKGSKTYPYLFIYSCGHMLLYILLYVDDIIVTGNNKGTIDNIICQLGSAFALKDLGPLNYFLGIEIVPHVSDILLSQKKYILELLQRVGLFNCNLVSSPMVTSSSLSLDDMTAFSNPVKYRQNHWSAVKRILRYLHGTVEHGMLIRYSSGSTLQAFTDVLWKGNPDTSLEDFSDADWAGDPDDRRISFAKPSKRRANIDMRFPKTIFEDQSKDLEREVSWIECKLLRGIVGSLRIIPLGKSKRGFRDNVGVSSCFSEIRQFFSKINPDGAFVWVEIEVYWIRAKEVPGWTPDLVEDSDEEELSDDDSLEEGMKNLESENASSNSRNVVKVGPTMGYNMEGVINNLSDIIESQGASIGLNGIDLMIIAVYAPHDPRDKRMLWDYLAHVINQWQGEVVIMGDFNEVRVKSDRFGTNFNVLGANIFNSFINSTGLEEVHLGAGIHFGRFSPITNDSSSRVAHDYGPVPFPILSHLDSYRGLLMIRYFTNLNSALRLITTGMRNWREPSLSFQMDRNALGIGSGAGSGVTRLSHFDSLLKCFFHASGLKINLNKSKIMGINVESAQVIQAAAKLGCLILKCPFYYLGTRSWWRSMTVFKAWQEFR